MTSIAHYIAPYLKEKTVEVLGILLGLYCLYLKFWKKKEEE